MVRPPSRPALAPQLGSQFCLWLWPCRLGVLLVPAGTILKVLYLRWHTSERACSRGTPRTPACQFDAGLGLGEEVSTASPQAEGSGCFANRLVSRAAKWYGLPRFLEESAACAAAAAGCSQILLLRGPNIKGLRGLRGAVGWTVS